MSLSKQLTYGLIFLLCLTVNAQSKDSVKTKNESNHEDFEFKISPYGWLAGMATDVGGEKIRQSFNDLSSITNLGFQIAAQVRYKKWFLHSNFTYANLQVTEPIFSTHLDLDIIQLIWDNKIGYLAIDRTNEDDGIIKGWSMETTLGMIYWSNNIDLKLTISDDLPIPPIALSQQQNWTDLVVGVNFNIILSKTVNLYLSSNFGGFGIGNSSKIYYDLFYANTFRISKLLSVTAGYKTFHYQRENGSGAETLNTEVSTFGPLIGVSFHL